MNMTITITYPVFFKENAQCNAFFHDRDPHHDPDQDFDHDNVVESKT